MRSTSIISLFAEPTPAQGGPSGVMVSTLVHAVVCGLIWIGLKHHYLMKPVPPPKRYTVRVMDIEKPEPQLEWAAQHGAGEPSHTGASGGQAAMHADALGGSPDAAPVPRIPPALVMPRLSPQTLIQPDVTEQVTLAHPVPLPQVVLWSKPEVVAKKITPPPPQLPAKIDTPVSLETPNQEQLLAEVRVTATQFETKVRLPPPSKTTPVKVLGPTQQPKIPQTMTKRPQISTTAAMAISISDLQMQQGTVALPRVNAIAPATATGSLAMGKPKLSQQSGSGNADSKQGAGGTSTTPGSASGKAGTVAATSTGSGQAGAHNAADASGQGASTTKSGAQASAATSTAPANGQGGTHAAAANEVGGDNIDAGGRPAPVHVTLPKTGSFGVTVIGSSVADDYPETVGLWSGRLAYTVYLHIGAAKNWILQYSVMRAKDASVTGATTRPEAPWPYDIQRPTIDPDINADAIMVHGFVNETGHFEKLAVVFPEKLAETTFLLHALQQWQFRPAMQNGQATPVEILLIIPEAVD
jgi:hypothetical protein